MNYILHNYVITKVRGSAISESQVITVTRGAETVTSFPWSAATIRTRLVYVQLDSAVGIYEEEERL